MAGRIRFATFALVVLVFPILAGDAPNPSVERMRTDLTFLASAECEGRGPGTAGIDKAADYIAEEFRKAGLKGAMPDGSFFQPFTIKGAARLAKDVELSLAGEGFGSMALKLNSSFNPMPETGAGTVDAPIVFAGYGISSKSFKYDDYAGLDAEGKVVLVIRRTPRYGQEKSLFADEETLLQIDKSIQQVATFEAKIANAKKHHAAALLLVNDAGEADDNLREFRSVTGNDESIPAFHIKRSVGDQLLRSGMGKSLEDVERAIDAS